MRTYSRSSLAATVAACLSLICPPTTLLSQVPETVQAGPEQKRLEVWVGEWTYQGTQVQTPQGPGGTFTGRQSVRMILNGFFLETKWTDTGTYSGKQLTSEGVDLQWYDGSTKTYQGRTYENDGATAAATISVTGRTWISAGTRTGSDGKACQARFSNTLSEDGNTCATKGELSVDGGKTWLPWMELTLKKVGK